MTKRMLMYFLFIMTVVLAACGNGEDNAKDTSGDKKNASLLEEIKEEGVLKVGTEGTYAPFTFHDESGTLTGFDVEVIEEVAKRMDVKVEFSETQWDAIFGGIDAGRFHLIANQVGVTDERKEKYLFTEPYAEPSAVLITHKENTGIKSIKDMKGKKAAQTMTSNWGKLAEEQGAEIVKVEGFNESVQLVASKRAEGTFNDELSAALYMKEQPNAPLQIIEHPDYTIETAFLMEKGNEELAEEINKILKEMREDGTLSKISMKWFDVDVS